MSFVTVVSGLPRSGTSLMMQMLAAGGIEPLTDYRRPPDADNPRGYFEYEPVLRTRHDPSWVPRAVGGVVKVIHVLLNDLPDGFEYRVILMRRPLGEVLRSQRTMLERSGKTPPAIAEDRLAATFRQQLQTAEERIARRSNFRVMGVEYHDCLDHPVEVTAALCAFLERDLDAGAMLAAIDRLLYRHR